MEMTENELWEKVIKCLKHCIGDNCCGDKWSECEYSGHGCIDALLEDALALLKAQEPRVMTLDEVKSCGNPVWLEWKYYFIKPAFLHSEEVMTDDNRNAVTFVLFGDEEWYTYADDDYGKEIRCWTSCPTDEQREAIPWND